MEFILFANPPPWVQMLRFVRHSRGFDVLPVFFAFWFGLHPMLVLLVPAVLILLLLFLTEWKNTSFFGKSYLKHRVFVDSNAVAVPEDDANETDNYYNQILACSAYGYSHDGAFALLSDPFHATNECDRTYEKFLESQKELSATQRNINLTAFTIDGQPGERLKPELFHLREAMHVARTNQTWFTSFDLFLNMHPDVHVSIHTFDKNLMDTEWAKKLQRNCNYVENLLVHTCSKTDEKKYLHNTTLQFKTLEQTENAFLQKKNNESLLIIQENEEYWTHHKKSPYFGKEAMFSTIPFMITCAAVLGTNKNTWYYQGPRFFNVNLFLAATQKEYFVNNVKFSDAIECHGFWQQISVMSALVWIVCYIVAWISPDYLLQSIYYTVFTFAVYAANALFCFTIMLLCIFYGLASILM